ncbi:MAG: PDZ domain-containing protein [Ruminococcus sp.]|nr:PDZ domain-containing protein [Ruminococcus sp.]
MDKKQFQNYAVVAIVSAIISCTATWGGFIIYNKDKLKAGEQFSLLAECRKIADMENIHVIDEEAAINGYLTSGYDKYTFVKFDEVDTEENEENDTVSYVNTSGTAKASGFEIDKSDDGNILLVRVDEDKAAYKSGLREGDVIIAISGIDVAETGFENIARKLLGKKDTKVELIVRRGEERFDITFIRDHVYIRNVEWEKIDGIGYLHIKHFDMQATGHFTEGIQELGDVHGYVIDLRNCPGGSTGQCVDMLGVLCKNVKVYANSKNQGEHVYEPNALMEPINKPCVLLVNSSTASSAEIFTAGMKQFSLGGSVVVGETTFGKGISQTDFELSTGAILHCTFSEYTVGDWESYQEKGISPDIELAMDYSLIGTENDIQLKKALELLD